MKKKKAMNYEHQQGRKKCEYIYIYIYIIYIYIYIKLSVFNPAMG